MLPRYAHGSRLSLPRRDETKKFLARFALYDSHSVENFCSVEKRKDKVTPLVRQKFCPLFRLTLPKNKAILTNVFVAQLVKWSDNLLLFP